MASTIQIKRGTGSAVPSGLADGELAINLDNGQLYFGSGSTSVNDFTFNNITVNQLTSSIVTSSIIETSGSNIFGDDSSDTHLFRGNITASGNISSSGIITANSLVGTLSTAAQTNITSVGTLESLTVSGDINANGNIVGDGATQLSGLTHITAIGNMALGNHSSDSHTITGKTTFTGNVTASGDISASGYVTATHITASGNISASGNIYANRFSDFVEILTSGNGATIAVDSAAGVGNSIFNLAIDGTTKIQLNKDTVATNFFGNTVFDSPITASGNISSSAYIYAERYYANDQLALNNVNGAVTLGYDNTYPINIGKSTNPIKLYGHVTASGNISSSGTIFATRVYPNGPSGPFIDQVNDNLQFSTGIKTLTHITASGDISSSGTIFTDTISSPTNNLVVSSSTVTITSTTDNEANLILEADTDNNDENDNPFMSFKQDGGAIVGVIGLSGDADKWPDGTTLTGVTANAMVIGMTGSASSTNRQLYLAAGNTASLEIKNDAHVHIMNGNLFLDGTNALYGNGHLIAKFDSEIIIGAGNRPLELNSTTTEINGLPTFTGAITASSDISASGTISGQAGLTKHSITGTTDGEAKGDVVYFGGGSGLTIGSICHYNSSGNWELADADAASTSDGLLGVTLATAPSGGILLRGMVTLDHDPGAVGDVLYVSTTAGDATSTAPSGNGDIVRIIGYCLDASNGQIWFNPDSTFVEVNA